MTDCRTWAHFNVDLLNNGITRAGQPALWFQAFTCPCRKPETLGADPTCPVCDGRGSRWDAGVAVQIGFATPQATREFDLPTAWVNGDAMITLPTDSPAYHAGEYDRFVLTETTYRYSSILSRGTTDTLPYHRIACVERVWMIANGQPITLREYVDYRLDENRLVWLTNAVPVGTQYAVQYRAMAEYFVFKDLVQDHHAFGDALPRKVHVRVMSLFGQGSL